MKRKATTLAVVLAAFGLQVAIHDRARDSQFDDDSGYLQAGLDFVRSPPRAERSVLYVGWYWLGSLATRTTPELRHLAWAGLLAVNLGALWLVMRGLQIPSSLSGLAVATASFFGCFYWVRPYVSLLAAAFCLLGLAAGVRSRMTAGGLSMAAIGLALASFVRPEITLAFGIVFGATIMAAAAARTIRPVFLPLAAFLGLAATFGNPLGASRADLAFGQHYAMNVVAARHLAVDYWHDWERFVRADFGRPVTPLQAMRANPSALLRHVGRNVRSAAITGMSFVPAGPKPLRVAGGALFALAFVLGLTFAAPRIATDRRAQLVALVGASLCIPWAVSALLIHPRAHYFVPAFLVLVPLAVWGFVKRRVLVRLPDAST